MKKSKALWAGISSALITAAAAVSLSVVPASAADVLYGDANCDGEVTIADATAILQYIGNKDKYGLTDQGKDNADVYNRGDGISGLDALSVQKLDAKILTELPESWKDGAPAVDPAADATKIHLKGDSAEVEGDYAEVNGGVITITHSGEFYVDGTLDDGQINVAIPDEAADAETVKIFLNGVNITGKSAPAILVTNAENTSINIVDGTENFIQDGDTAYPGGEALILAKDDITFKGGDENSGKLTITANTQNAVACNNDIKFTGGKTKIKTLSSEKTNGVNGKKSVTVKGGKLDINATGDGLKSSKGDVSITDGKVEIKAGNDAIQAETSIDISGGTVLVGGDRGLTAVTGVNITGGKVVATATDNQVDEKLLAGSTQGVKLFNMVSCPESEDGTWKKSYTFGSDNEFTKKFCFVLISDAEYTTGSSADYRVKDSEGNDIFAVAHEGNYHFEQTAAITAYNAVEFISPSSSVTPEPSPAPDTYSITLKGSTVTSNAPSDAYRVSSGSLTILQPGTFEVSGESKDVQIVVDVDTAKYPDGVVELDLMGVTMTHSTTAPIYVANIGDEVQIVAKKGTVNVISDGASHTQTYTDSDGKEKTVEGAIFARDDIKFKGAGELTVNGNTDDAIVCRNDIKIYNGTLYVNAQDDGIRGKDSVTIGKADDTDYSTLSVTVKTVGGDGIKSSSDNEGKGIVTVNGGTVDIKAYADGIQAEQDVVINGGDLNIYTYQGSGYTGSGTTTGGNTQQPGRPGGGGWGGGGMGMDGNANKVENSAKGIKATGIYDAAGTTWQSGGNITVTGGNITIDSSDDALHCGGSMAITGGQFKIATADDALHSDHDLTLGTKGGAYGDFGIYVTKCYEGVEGQNIDQYSGTVVVKADDDGYNAAGGSDGSGNQNPGGFFPGGGFGGGGGDYRLNIEGGIAIVQSASGDHDAFDSNGSLSVTGGVVIANGQEPLDSDGTNTVSGGNVLAVSSQSTGTVASGTQFTVADAEGNVIVSFKTMQGMGAITTKKSTTTLSLYTGGTITGGEDLIKLDDTQPVYASDKISGGTTVTAGSGGGSSQRPGGR